MSIIYSWQNPNRSELTKIEVYRSDKRNGEKTLIATLPGTATFFEDVNASVNRVYYYNTVAYQGSLSVPSSVIPLASFENTGPGNSKLLRGDWEFGYFGSVLKVYMPTMAQIGTTVGSNPDYYTNNQLSVWHKWVVNGNIIFIPNVPLNTVGQTLQSLIDKKAAVPMNGDETNLVRYTLNGFTYRLRPPYVSNVLQAKSNDGTMTNLTSGINGTDPTLGISELSALIRSFIAGDTGNRLNAQMHYADSLMPTSDFNKYFWTNSPYNATAFFAIAYASNLNSASSMTPPNTGVLFWPILVLDL